MLVTLAACGSGPMCPDALQVCLRTDQTTGKCYYAAAACCGGAWTCSVGTIASAPGTCFTDDTMTEACQ